MLACLCGVYTCVSNLFACVVCLSVSLSVGFRCSEVQEGRMFLVNHSDRFRFVVWRVYVGISSTLKPAQQPVPGRPCRKGSGGHQPGCQCPGDPSGGRRGTKGSGGQRSGDPPGSRGRAESCRGRVTATLQRVLGCRLRHNYAAMSCQSICESGSATGDRHSS